MAKDFARRGLRLIRVFSLTSLPAAKVAAAVTRKSPMDTAMLPAERRGLPLGFRVFGIKILNIARRL